MKNLASDHRPTGHSFLCPSGDLLQPALAQALCRGAQLGWPGKVGQGEGESQQLLPHSLAPAEGSVASRKPSRGSQDGGLAWKETAAWSSLLLALRWFLARAQGDGGRCHGPFSPPPAPDTIAPTCSRTAALTVTLCPLVPPKVEVPQHGPSYSQEGSGAAGHRVSTDFCPRPPQRRPQVAGPSQAPGQVGTTCLVLPWCWLWSQPGFLSMAGLNVLG